MGATPGEATPLVTDDGVQLKAPSRICLLVACVVAVVGGVGAGLGISFKDRAPAKNGAKLSDATPTGPICIVQFDSRDLGRRYSLYAANNEAVCHSSSVPCTYIFSNGNGTSFGTDVYPTYWGKVLAVQTAIHEADCGVAFWIDMDAVITSADVAKLELAMDGRAMLVSADPYWVVNTSFNAGVWGVRNNEDGRMLINLWTSLYNSSKWMKGVDITGAPQWTCSDNPLSEGAESCVWAGADYEQGAFEQKILPMYGPASNDHKITTVEWRVLNNIDCHADDTALVHHFMLCGPQHQTGCCGMEWCAKIIDPTNKLPSGFCDATFDFQFHEPIPGSRFIDEINTPGRLSSDRDSLYR